MSAISGVEKSSKREGPRFAENLLAAEELITGRQLIVINRGQGSGHRAFPLPWNVANYLTGPNERDSSLHRDFDKIILARYIHISSNSI